MLVCIRLKLDDEIWGRFVDAGGDVRVGVRHEPCRTADTDGHNSPTAEAKFYSKVSIWSAMAIFVERTGSAIDDAMIQRALAADAAGKKGRNNNAVEKKRKNSMVTM